MIITTRDLFDRMYGNSGEVKVTVDDTVWTLDRAYRSGTSYWFEGYDTSGEPVKCDVVTKDLDEPMWELATA